ncbi:hypothetical protein A6V39_00890 [Candidatus Mycoplasma haematobovis]|uniref:Uncharacterized protein n=1 Tax=Candidatus Mycoplasma haematobovis TaxID=432608 RepID=A0A1A9QEE3_9MOLU|nr:hypothetical protein [Candidatus Mycoplasma haematobovis]OAL10608.1 hypothetical protein A6V39_00890 [Candidatus Mycoplasma haematobovis]
MELIGDTEEQKWTPKWNTFKTDFKSVNPPLGWVMEDWDNKKTSPTTPPEFKKLCQDNGAKKINNNEDSNFSTTEKYCTKTLRG